MKELLKSEILGGTIFFIGLFFAVCIVDGLPNELLMRITGLAVCIIGATIAKSTPTPKAKANEDDEREEEQKVDHEPYPEE